MASLSEIANSVVRQEIETFVHQPDERTRLIDQFARAAPEMQAIAAALIEADHGTVDQLVRTALADGRPANEILRDGLIAGMSIVGVKFRDGEIFVPEVLASARAMKVGMAHLEPSLAAAGVAPAGRVVMGTVKGDLHDIGKNLCIMMLRGAGFEVIDLGVDVSADEFIAAIEEHHPDVVGLSALLTTTMPNMGRTIDAFVDAGVRDQVRIMVGGAPLSQAYADEIGADGYGKDAIACVDLARILVPGESAPR